MKFSRDNVNVVYTLLTFASVLMLFGQAFQGNLGEIGLIAIGLFLMSIIRAHVTPPEVELLSVKGLLVVAPWVLIVIGWDYAYRLLPPYVDYRVYPVLVGGLLVAVMLGLPKIYQESDMLQSTVYTVKSLFIRRKEHLMI